jgi:nitrilase
MKLRHDFAGHYNRPDIFHLQINRAAPRLYSVHNDRLASEGERTALERPQKPGLLEPPAANGGRDDGDPHG